MIIRTKDYEIEMSLDEFNKLFKDAGIDKVVDVCPPIQSNSAPETSLSNLKKRIKHNSGRKRKTSLEQIKQIKDMAMQGMDSKEIASILKIDRQIVDYWRKNTPKELIE